ncbi:MAG: septal ring lytic transglycosylase RlpA family protein [Chromatiaceae bacterium]|nr:septal ring lytic transglycosylase RlpA family protein [Chromatiaceae bacterium]
MTMGRHSKWQKSQIILLTGAALLLSLGLLSGCSSTIDRDSATGNPPDLSSIEDAQPKIEPKSKYGNPETYVVFGKRYYTKASSKGYVERGIASWYGKKFHGRKTSSGERYDMYGMTAAHKTLPLPTYARVTNVKNGRSAVVKINDRGPFHGKRVIDLSYTAARKLGVVATGTAMVEVRAIDPSRPGTERQDSFLASADDAAETRSPAPEKVLAARKTPAAKKPVARSKATETRVAKVDKADTHQKNTPLRIAKTTKTSVPMPKAMVAKAEASPGLASGSSMYLQVGAFGSRLNAEQLRRRLVDHIAEQVQVRSTDGEKSPWYKVRVGPLDSRKSAKDLSQKLASMGLQGSHVIVE